MPHRFRYPVAAFFCSAAVCLAAEQSTWKFDSSEQWTAQPKLELSVGFDGLEIGAERTPEWGKPPAVYTLTEAAARKKMGDVATVEFNAELLSGGGATMALRLRDADGEFFAYPQLPLKPGTNRIHWDVVKGSAGSWGEKKNGKVDFPVRLEALELQQYPAKEPARVLLRTPEVPAKAGMVRIIRPLVKFDDTAKWSLDSRLEGEQTPEGLLVRTREIPESGKPPVIGRMKEVMFGLKDIGAPDAIAFDVEVRSGSGVNLALELTDAGGESFAMRQKPLHSGKNRVVWDLANDIAGSWGKNKDGKIDFPVQLVNIVVHQYPASKPAELLFRQGVKRETLRKIDAAEFRLDTGSPAYVLKIGDAPKFRFHNLAPEKNAFAAKLRLYTLTGAERRFERNFELKPGEEAVWTPDWPESTPHGVWRCDLTLRDEAGNEARLTRPAFAYLTPAGPTKEHNPEFEVGMNMRQQHWSLHDRETEAEGAAAIGVKLLRTGYTWESLEPSPGEFRFDRLDDLMALNGKYGMEHIFMVSYTPAWAAKPELVKNAKDWNEWNKSAPDPDALEKFVETFAARYKGKIRIYEFWNEPDLDFWRGTADEYLECLKQVSRALRRTDPDAKLITGGFAFASDHPRAKSDFQDRILREGKEFFDYHGMHQHGDFSEFRKMLDEPLADRRKKTGSSGKPLFFTETGFYISNGNYMQQAANVIRKIVYARAVGARGYLWFDMRDDGFLPGYCEHNYGLTTNDFYPKEGFAALNTLNLLLGQARFGGVLTDNSRTTAYWFRSGDDQAVAFWTAGRGAVEEPLTVLTDAKTAETIDLFGNAVPVGISGGRLTVPAPEYPGFLLLRGAKRKPECGLAALAFSGTRITAAPGAPATVAVTLRNPLKTSAKVELRWNLPAGVSAPLSQTQWQLAAGEAVNLSLPLTVPTGSSGGIVRPELQVRLNGDAWSSFPVPVNIATRIADRSYSEKPQFTLDSRKNMVSQMEHNPYTSHRVWSGPEDQSVRVFLAADDSNLNIRVDVTDDAHVKSKSAETSYMEDGLQLALAVPGQNGHWEFGFAELGDGSPGTHCWINPRGLAAPKPGLQISRSKQTIRYDIAIPLAGIGVSPERLKEGIQFNLLINDNDGEGRDGWMQIAPGIGEAKNPEQYPFILKQ